jgi:hypothetical protein
MTILILSFSCYTHQECVRSLSDYPDGYATLDDVTAARPSCQTLLACEEGGYQLRTDRWSNGSYAYYNEEGDLFAVDPYVDLAYDDCDDWTDWYGPSASCEPACLIEHFDGCLGADEDTFWTQHWEETIGLCK